MLTACRREHHCRISVLILVYDQHYIEWEWLDLRIKGLFVERLFGVGFDSDDAGSLTNSMRITLASITSMTAARRRVKAELRRRRPL